MSGPRTLLSDAQRHALMIAADKSIDAVDEVVEQLKRESPEAFHTRSSLAQRVFCDQPRTGTPHASYTGRRF